MTSAFTSEDRELDKILRALSDLSKTFKLGAVDPVAVDATLKRAALWAVQKSLLDREVRSLAITDDLTGFFNRRGFLASVTQQLKLARRENKAFCSSISMSTISRRSTIPLDTAKETWR